MTTKYPKQQLREKVTPPHVSLGDLRAAVGITLEELAHRVSDVTDGAQKPSRGTLSALENGMRGASTDLLQAIALAYGMRPTAVTTNYVPRAKADLSESA